MNGYQKFLLGLTGCILGALLVVSGAVLTALWGDGLRARRPEMERRFTVQGTGLVRARPDVCRATLHLQGRGKTAAEAQQQVQVQMKRLLFKLTELGVSEKDLQTGEYSLEPTVTTQATPSQAYEYTRPGVRRWVSYPAGKTIRSFVARNTLQVTLRQVDRAGLFLDAAIAAGAESISNVRFEVDDLKPLRQRARELAARNARERAEAIAAGVGARLGRVISLSETPPPPSPMDPWASRNVASEVYQGRQQIAPPVHDDTGEEDAMEPGMLEVTAKVYVVYELK